MVNYRNFWVIFLVFFGLDLASKSWVVSRAMDLKYDPIVLIDGIKGNECFLEITYVTNTGAAWSMLSDYPEFLTILAAFALVSIFMFRRGLELEKFPQQIIFGMICGGIAGNLTDRIFRTPAAVVDFIDVYFPFVGYDYPVFNVADSGIFLGATSYFIWSLLEVRKEKLSEKILGSEQS